MKTTRTTPLRDDPQQSKRFIEMARDFAENGYISVRLGDVGEDYTNAAERKALRKAFKVAEKAGFNLYRTDKGMGLEIR